MHHIIPPTPCIVDRSKHVLIYGMHSLGVDKNNVQIPRSVSSPIKLSQVLSGSFFLFWTRTENWFLARLYIPYTTVFKIQPRTRLSNRSNKNSNLECLTCIYSINPTVHQPLTHWHESYRWRNYQCHMILLLIDRDGCLTYIQWLALMKGMPVRYKTFCIF